VATKKRVAKKPKSHDSDWEKEMEQEAEAESARERSGGSVGNVLSIKGRKFSFSGESLGRDMKCIVVDAVYLNSWYAKKYDEEKQGDIPACFALSVTGADMAPHENSKKPQADSCEGCEKNEWGSGGKRRKACRQGRKLAVIHIDDAEDADAIAEAEIAILNLPPTSVKRWGTYVKDVKAKFSRPFWAVVTACSFDQDADYPVLEFDTDEKLDKELALAVKARRDEVREQLLTPFESHDDDDDDDEDEDEAPKRKKKAAPAKKAPAKKRKVEEEEELDDEDDEDEDDEELDDDEDDDEDDEELDDDEDDDEDDEEEEEEEKPKPKKKGSRFRRK